MSIAGFNRFLRDESGGYTIWSLIWFSLYVAMGGLAVDVTDAYRNQTMLQSTADASSLAAVMSLPDQTDALAQALTYATDNMNPAINGNVLDADEVFFGNWDFDTKTWTRNGAPLNAVRVITRRDDENNNALATNFLRILGLWGLPLDSWNISVEAVAVEFVPNCRKGGFVAANKVDVTSGNYFFNDICVHGQNMTEDSGPDFAIDLNTGNRFQRRTCNPGEYGPCGVQVSMPKYEYMNDRPNLYEKNEDLTYAMKVGDVIPSDALDDGVKNIIDGLTDPESGHMPEYIDTEANDGQFIYSPPEGEKFAGPYDPGIIYDVKCSSDKKTLRLPTDEPISNVVIITNCKIGASEGLILEGVILASTALGNGNDPLDNKAIDFASAARFGATDFCTTGKGGVELYTLASVKLAGKPSMNGLRAVVGGDFQFPAQGTALGVSIQAGNDIIFTAAGSKGGEFGLCLEGTLPPGKFVPQYRLVR